MITSRQRQVLAYLLARGRKRWASKPPVPGNLAAWYHTGAGLVVDGANAVSQWQDQSGNGRHLLQASGVAQPLLTRADNQGNLLEYSEQFGTAPWVLTGITVVGSQINDFNLAPGERLSQTYQYYASMSGRSFNLTS